MGKRAGALSLGDLALRVTGERPAKRKSLRQAATERQREASAPAASKTFLGRAARANDVRSGEGSEGAGRQPLEKGPSMGGMFLSQKK